MVYLQLRACLNNRWQCHFCSIVGSFFQVFILVFNIPVAPLGLRCTGFWCFYTPSAPLRLLEAGAQGISIALLNQSVDRTLQTYFIKQDLSVIASVHNSTFFHRSQTNQTSCTIFSDFRLSSRLRLRWLLSCYRVSRHFIVRERVFFFVLFCF